MNKIRALVLVVWISSLSAGSLTLSDALAEALHRNHGIGLARLEKDQAAHERMRIPGYVLPRLSARGGVEYSRTDGGEEHRGSRAGLYLDWTLFDGFAMFYSQDLTDMQSTQRELRAREAIEETAMEVAARYYEFLHARTALSVAEQQLSLSAEYRDLRAEEYAAGNVPRTDMLTQRVRYNSDKAQYVQAQQDSLTAHMALNIAMGRPPDTVLSVAMDTTLPEVTEPAEYWVSLARENNRASEIKSLAVQIRTTEKAIARARLWPTFSAATSAVQQGGDNSGGRFTASIQVDMPILDGFSRRTARYSAATSKERARLEQEEQVQVLTGEVHRIWQEFHTARQQIAFETEAVAAAEESLALLSEAFKRGSVDALALRESQMEYITAKMRRESALYQSRMRSLQLRQVAGGSFF
ncbi:TolC family protein [Chitinivibrio alkaliphilus]|uniref:Outer membrane protein TolC n=1 Tax=Chitinivibrio alkaliphilus ACht1 TaxID=1313304 RepID=U7D9W1_9BACT|nr:TolC family protein [Chitinivibrio alkaliphilus]ERP38772.1 outer membrane protein TolC [Chitinivibrio alkaliphilus ACht1]